MQFTYKATTKDGRTISGTVEAASRAALIASLRKQEVSPVVITEQKGKSKSKDLFGPKKKVKLQDLVIFTRQLSTMISAGVPLARSFAALADDSSSPYMREVLAGITKDVEGGTPL